MAPGRLRIFGSRKPIHRDPIKQDSPILDLPLDIVFEIFNALLMPAKILFSQSCRDLWYPLRSECYKAVQSASAAERLKCLASLGDILPNHRLCIGCNALCLVTPKDLPVRGFDSYHDPLPAFESLWSRRRLLPRYSLTGYRPSASWRHWNRRQLLIYCSVAIRNMKLTRSYDIRSIYKTILYRNIVLAVPQYYSMRLEFFAGVEIVHGKVILMTLFELWKHAEFLTFGELSHLPMGFCSHLWTHGPTTSEMVENPLVTAIRLALDNNLISDLYRLHVGHYSCDTCPTNYSVSIMANQATFSIWQELGTGVSPANPFWRSHTMDSKENNQRNATEYSYRHGNLRGPGTTCNLLLNYRPS
ncbi:hypothetical protein MMC17_005126 [Xylographa soralifera]|nr:hypothetical protein [Xylographa soralifera]